MLHERMDSCARGQNLHSTRPIQRGDQNAREDTDRVEPELLARLHDTDCFPESADHVEVRQTHLSVVCLVGDAAYKLKKPVHLPFVDFSTPELRERFCQSELRLNRRLCPDVYLAVVPLFQTPDGSWSFSECAGEIVDYAVRMKRLPEDLLMDRLLDEEAVSKEQVGEIARVVARFHKSAERTAEILSAGSPENQRAAILDNFETCADAFDAPLHRAVQRRAVRDLNRLLPVLAARAKRGLVVDGHGDLHARNVCLTDPPTIFDCIEFKPEFRCGDVAVENAFLVMDLIYRGHPELAQAYLDAYIQETGDEEQREVMPMFMSYRAMVRAKVAALTAADPDVEESDRVHARESAARHLQLAAAAALSGDRILLLACGLPGTGKSYLCQVLAEHSGWPIESSDPIRKELAGFQPDEDLPDEYYDSEFSAKTYDELTRRVGLHLTRTSVIADANFPSINLRRRSAAAEAKPVIAWVTAADEVVLPRLRDRAREDTAVSDADIAVYRKLKAAFEPPDESDGIPVIQIDGSDPLDSNLNRLLTALLDLR
ncbi:MAG: aminoglycoside phosphotransferase family enzyme/predicted kinase [Verrucomicrobiales bacterium]|jgi:aminoglycoside phosphotransferase family enzyme/predicted kinase